jgi:hypothetical protein
MIPVGQANFESKGEALNMRTCLNYYKTSINEEILNLNIEISNDKEITSMNTQKLVNKR